MFTGLVEATGTVLSSTRSDAGIRLTIAAPGLAPRLNTGDSIAVSGVCLTAKDITSTQFSADLAQETVDRTTLSHLQVGSLVNLELPRPAGSPLGGHIVQGHVDGTATLISLLPIHPSALETDWRLKLQLPADLTRYVVPQGSITVEGISLTVASVQHDEIEIAIIPHTYSATSLHTRKSGDLLNIEVDILAKYAERQTAARTAKPQLSLEYLIANGY